MPEQTTAARQVARQGPADLDVKLAARLLRKHRVEGHHFPNIDRLQSELGGDPTDLLCAEKSEVLL